MGLIYAKNIKHARRKVRNQVGGDADEYGVSLSKQKSAEKGYKLYNVRKKWRAFLPFLYYEKGGCIGLSAAHYD